MTLEIKFELTDTDLEYFRSGFEQAREKLATTDQQELIGVARALVDSALERDYPEFVRRRLNALGRVIRMVEDETWQIPEDARERVMQALAYFADPDDLVADDVPVLGLIDDALAIELALAGLQHELEAYEEFAAYRGAEAQRRANRGQTTEITTEDWLADRRAALHSRMRERNNQASHGWRYTTF